MAIEDLKFTQSEFVDQDIESLPDKVVGQAAWLKQKFDNIAKNKIALGRFNELIDYLAGADGFVPKSGGVLTGDIVPDKNNGYNIGTDEKRFNRACFHNLNTDSSIRIGGKVNADGGIISTGMYDVTTSTAANVFIASTGEMRRSSSLRKYKKNICDVTEQEAQKAYNLRPRSFYGIHKGIDDMRQFGFVAEEVNEVLPELCSWDGDQINGVQYERVAALLVKQNQMLKEKVDSLEARLCTLEEVKNG